MLFRNTFLTICLKWNICNQEIVVICTTEQQQIKQFTNNSFVHFTSRYTIIVFKIKLAWYMQFIFVVVYKIKQYS